MKVIISLILVSINFISFSFCMDNYEVGDELYVWAANGLNLREGPGTNYKIIDKFEFGTSVIIKQKTEYTFNITGITKTDSSYYLKKVDPIIFKGKWVKVSTKSGDSGYVIDQYLMDLKPISTIDKFSYQLNLEPIAVDTVAKNLIPNEGELFEFSTKKTYKRGITEVETSGGDYAERSYAFEKYTFEEVMVLFSSSLNDYNDFVVLKNWKEEIEFSDNEICTFKIKKQNEVVILTISCSC